MSERKGESRLREQVTGLLRKSGLVASCVEGGGLGGTPGVPDVHYAGTVSLPDSVAYGFPAFTGYMEGWIELKVLDGEVIAKKARTGEIPVVTGLGHYTAAQRVWHTKHSRVGGRCHVLLRADYDEPWFYLYEGAWAAAHLGKDLHMRDFSAWSLFNTRHDPRKFPDVDHLLRALQRNEPLRKPIL